MGDFAQVKQYPDEYEKSFTRNVLVIGGVKITDLTKLPTLELYAAFINDAVEREIQKRLKEIANGK